MQTEREKLQMSNGSRGIVLWAAAVLVIASVIGIAWWGYPLMTKHDGLSKPLTGQAAADPLGDRLSAVEQKWNSWAKEKAGMMDLIAEVQKSMSSNVRRARSEATALVEGVKRDVAQSLGAIQSRLTGVESAQNETRETIASLQSDLASARRDLDAVREMNTELAGQLRQNEQVQQSTQTEVAEVKSRVMSHQDRIGDLSYQVQRRRIDFEVVRDRTDEVASGLYLTINRTDVRRQQVNGWLQIAADGRIVWLRNAGAQHPIPFSTRGDNRGYELVITRVGDGSTTGYLLAPEPATNTEVAAK